MCYWRDELSALLGSVVLWMMCPWWIFVLVLYWRIWALYRDQNIMETHGNYQCHPQNPKIMWIMHLSYFYRKYKDIPMATNEHLVSFRQLTLKKDWSELCLNQFIISSSLVGIDYKTTTILLDGRRVKLQLWWVALHHIIWNIWNSTCIVFCVVKTSVKCDYTSTFPFHHACVRRYVISLCWFAKYEVNTPNVWLCKL